MEALLNNFNARLLQDMERGTSYLSGIAGGLAYGGWMLDIFSNPFPQ